MTFNDGTPLTSADVDVHPRAGDRTRHRHRTGRAVCSGIDGADGLRRHRERSKGSKAVDDRTVEITLAAPDGAFLVNLCSFSGSRHSAEAHSRRCAAGCAEGESVLPGARPSRRARSASCSTQTDQYLEMKPQRHYPGKVGLDRSSCKIVTPDVGLGQLETGEIDLMALPVSEMERVSGLDGVTVVSVPSPSMDFLALNLERPYLQNQKAAPGDDVRDRPRGHRRRRSSRARARSSIRRSSAPTGWACRRGSTPTRTIRTRRRQCSTDPAGTRQPVALDHDRSRHAGRSRCSPSCSEQLKAGRLQPRDPAGRYRRADSPRMSTSPTSISSTTAAASSAPIRASPPPTSTRRTSLPAAATARTTPTRRWTSSSPRARPQTDPAERKAIYTEVAQILNDEVPWIFLWSPNSIFGVQQPRSGLRAAELLEQQALERRGVDGDRVDAR